jgi:ABC-type polysaccharide/polyol phosphate export permease
MYARRELMMAFARRDFATRYRASALGWLWSLLQPLATLVLFSLVFTIIFRVQAPPLGNGHGSSYPAYLFTGLVTWNLLTGLMNSSMTQLLISGELLRKVAFPAWTAVVGGSVVQLMQVAVEFLVLVVMMVILGNVGWTWLLALPVMLAAACFGQGIGLFLAMLNAHCGDVRYTTTVVLAILYFLTPVMYPLAMLDGQGGVLAWVIILNPLTWYVSAMHDVMYSLVIPALPRFAALLVVGYGTLWAGFTYFNRRDDGLGELL